MQKHYFTVEDHQSGDIWLLIIATRNFVPDAFARKLLIEGCKQFYWSLKGQVPNLKWSDVIEHFYDIVGRSSAIIAERCQLLRTAFNANTRQHLDD